jgi:excisionase family DNA binding protein
MIPINRTTLRIDEVARELGISEKTVRRRIRDGSLRAVRLGGVVLVRCDDLEQRLSA